MTRHIPLLFAALAILLLPRIAAPQGLTGAIVGTVRDAQGGVLPGALATVSSPALIGGAIAVRTGASGGMRFPALPPGIYNLEITLTGFMTHRESDIRVSLGGTLEIPVTLTLAGVQQSVEVEGAGSRMEARDPGFSTGFGPEDLKAIPSRRASMFDAIKSAPGISPTAPSSGTSNTFSAFGSGTNENTFLVDGTNQTCPCNGIARSEPGVDFIQEVHVQSAGASAEFGNTQGAVINVITKQGSERFLYDASSYTQTSRLTAQPVLLRCDDCAQGESGYARDRYRDFTTNLGGPAIRNRLWFFGGYQYLRDYDSQPGTDPRQPRTYEQNKVFAKLTWRLSPAWQVMQSLHEEVWVNPEQPTFARPFNTTQRLTATVPAITFADVTHTSSANTLWDMRVGRFVYSQRNPPSVWDGTTPGRLDVTSGIASGAPAQFGALTLMRTTAKLMVTRYVPKVFGASHEWKVGGQIERGEHHSPNVVPTGVRFLDRDRAPFQSVATDPSETGGRFDTASIFATDAVTVKSRITINAGFRIDRNQAASQDVPAVDANGRETDAVIRGAGTLYTWNTVSPRFGVTARLSADGRTMLRGSWGRFRQGVLTGELASFHPGATPSTTRDYVAADGDYTRVRSVFDPKTNLQLDPGIRGPLTDEFSVGIDRQVRTGLSVAVAYIRKDGHDFIGWEEVAGTYSQETVALADGRSVLVSKLLTPPGNRVYELTNPAGYSLTYNGLVMAVEKRRSHGWQAFGSYTLSRAYGLQPGSGAPAAGPQVSTVAPPPGPGGVTFGRDPNDLTNATGRLGNDRPHIVRAMASVNVPRTGFVVAANLQQFSGKPWGASALVNLPQNGQQRVLLEPRGTRRLSSQRLLDLRLSRTVPCGGLGRVDLLLDVLNALNERAEDGIQTDTQVTESVRLNPAFNKPTSFVDPRRVMLGLRVNLGR